MPSCSVFWCKKRSQTSNQQKDDITFHLFPKDIEIRSVWVKACGNHESWTPKRTSTICSAHFVTSCFITQSNNKRRLKQGSIPTLKLLSEFQPCEKSEDEQEPERKKFKTQPVQTEEGETSKLKTHSPEHNICIATTSTVNPQLQDTPRKIKLKKQLQMKNKQIKRLQSQKSYLKKKVAGLQEIMNTLSEKSLIDKEERQVLDKIGVEERELLKRQLIKSKTGKIPTTKYSAELRCFALTLHFYSPKAYRYVRKTFGTCLPAPRTLTRWYSSIDGQPGFTKEALVALKLRAECNPEKKIYCTLVFDEMKIKKSTEYISRTQRHYGYVNHGFDFISDNSDEATDALVFLLVGINTTWKLPIAYFLIKGMNACLRARLVTQAFFLVHETGVEIKAVTCDGTKANLAMAEELGCCLDVKNLQPQFWIREQDNNASSS